VLRLISGLTTRLDQIEGSKNLGNNDASVDTLRAVHLQEGGSTFVDDFSVSNHALT